MPSASQVLQLQRTIGNQGFSQAAHPHARMQERSYSVPPPGEHSARRYFARSGEKGAGQSVIKLDSIAAPANLRTSKIERVSL
jgi:hypothetical protein